MDMKLERLTDETLNSLLLERQWLSRKFEGTPLELMKSHGVVQTQEHYAGAQFFISRGMAGNSYDRLRAAGEAIRGTLHRCTIHSMSSEDFHLWQPIYAEKYPRFLERQGQRLPSDWRLLAKEALGDGHYKSREVIERLMAVLPLMEPKFQVMGSLGLARVPGENGKDLGPKELWTLACWSPLSEEVILEAGKQLVRRYLAAFGPARPSDFASWSGLIGAAKLFESVKEELWVGEDSYGKKLYDLKELVREPRFEPPAIAVLPPFDNIVLAFAERARIAPFSKEEKAAFFDSPMAPLMVDGLVVGSWMTRASKGGYVAKLKEIKRISPRHKRLLEKELERLLTESRGKPSSLSWLSLDA